MAKLTWRDRGRILIGSIVVIAWCIAFIKYEFAGDPMPDGLTIVFGIVVGAFWSQPLLKKVGDALYSASKQPTNPTREDE